MSAASPSTTPATTEPPPGAGTKNPANGAESAHGGEPKSAIGAIVPVARATALPAALRG
jgi:hypothetical protein